jgi:hypothetical protein
MRCDSRIQAANEIKLLSLTQRRTVLLDKKNKGGKSLLLRCTSNIKSGYPCPFYCKLRRSNKDALWYICTGYHLTHNCETEVISYKLNPISKMMLLRTNPDAVLDDDESDASKSPKRKLLEEEEEDNSSGEDNEKALPVKRLSIG